VTHVDDFLATGGKDDLKLFKGKLEEYFELKGTMLGPEKHKTKENKYVGRALRWKSDSIKYEGDNKHTKILLREWLLEDSKPTSSPGMPEDRRMEANDEETNLLDKTRAKAYRRGAARINDMSQDRMDLSFASNAISKGMANHTEADEIKIKESSDTLEDGQWPNECINGKTNPRRRPCSLTAIGLAVRKQDGQLQEES